MNDATFKKVIASLSRAIGNDLLAYEKHGDTYTLSLRSPIIPEKKVLLTAFLKSVLGAKGRVRINAKYGKITIWYGKRRA